MKEKVAIVGMGISGTAVLLAYKKEQNHYPDKQIEIDCYDSAESFGKGVPFREESSHALNNARSYQISYDYEQEDDFAKWLETRMDSVPEYASRSLFGEYLIERAQTLIETLSASAFHTRIKDIEWLPALSMWRLTPEDSSIAPRLYHRVHLCCGELPSRDFYELKDESRYINEPYPLHLLPSDIKDSDLAIIGMGLATVDLVRYLRRETKPAQLVVFSNENHFPAVRAHDDRRVEWHYLSFSKVESLIEKQAGRFTVENFTFLLEGELSRFNLSVAAVKAKYFLPSIQGLQATMKAADEVGLIQKILFQASEIMTIGWEAMDEGERAEFKAEYDKLVTTFRNPMPVESAIELIDGEQKGWLRVLDEVESIESSPNSEQLNLLTFNESLAVDWVINATGLDLSMKSLAKDSLLNNLLKRRYVVIDTAGGFSINVASGNMISPRYGEWPTLHAHGVLINGAIYQNNSTFKIQRFAHRLIKRLLSEAAIQVNSGKQ